MHKALWKSRPRVFSQWKGLRGGSDAGTLSPALQGWESKVRHRAEGLSYVMVTANKDQPHLPRQPTALQIKLTNALTKLELKTQNVFSRVL